MKLFSFVIPCYRSELTIEKVINEIDETVLQRKEEYDYEVIAVNDCSPDNVYSVLRKIAAVNPKVTAVNLAKNSGKHAALMAAFSLVKGDYVVCIDDDYQCPTYELWNLLKPIEDGADVSSAKYKKKMQSKLKNFGSSVNALMSTTMLGRPKHMSFENFLIIKRYIVDEILNYKNPYPYLEGLVLRTTTNIANVEMEERKRGDDKATGFTFMKSLSLWTNGFTAFSVKPLRIASIIGTFFSSAGIIYAIYTIIRKMLNPDVPIGYSSMMAAILIIGGIAILFLGLIGEYIGRIYICINNSPQYLIKEKLNKNTDESENKK